MQLTTVREIYKNRETFLDKEITVGGWVRSVRDSKTFGFIVLHDGTFFETLQVVYHDSMENFAEISRLNVGAAIIVKGTLCLPYIDVLFGIKPYHHRQPAYPVHGTGKLSGEHGGLSECDEEPVCQHHRSPG